MNFIFRKLLVPLALIISLFGSVLSVQAETHRYSVIFADWSIKDEETGHCIGYLSFFEVAVDAPGATGALFKNSKLVDNISKLEVHVQDKKRDYYDFEVKYTPQFMTEALDARMMVSLKGVDPNRLVGAMQIDGQIKNIVLVKHE